MNWKDIASAGKSVGKLDSLDVGQGTRDPMEAIMCAMAASGKVQEMALIAQTIEKVDTKVDLKEVATNLDRLVTTMQAKEAPKPDEDTMVITKSQFERMKAELSGK